MNYFLSFDSVQNDVTHIAKAYWIFAISATIEAVRMAWTRYLFILIYTMRVYLIFLPSLHSANSLLHTNKQSLSLQLPAQLIKSVSHNEVQVRLRS